MTMEERCEFIWQIIEESPVLRKKLKKLEVQNSANSEKQVNAYIDLFKEVEEIMEAVETYHSTRILNNNSL
jgi:hypothetical protein